MVEPGRVMSYDSYSLVESKKVRRCPFENVRVKVPLSPWESFFFRGVREGGRQ